MTDDPGFVNPGAGQQGINTLDGYMLQSNSPCVNSGLLVIDHASRDFRGNSVPYGEGTPDRGAFELQADPSSLVDGPLGPADRFQVFQNYPNPFNISTTIPYKIHRNGPVQIVVFNNQGQQVTSYDITHQSAGQYYYYWDGQDDSGHTVASGFYICKIKTGGQFQSLKLLLIK
jgi:hypothetical protein